MNNINKTLNFGTDLLANIFHLKPDLRKIISISRIIFFNILTSNYSIQLDKTIDIKKIITDEKIDKICCLLGPSFPSISNRKYYAILKPI